MPKTYYYGDLTWDHDSKQRAGLTPVEKFNGFFTTTPFGFKVKSSCCK